MVTDPASLDHDDAETAPQLFKNCCRACPILNRLNHDATQVFFGNSTIIVSDRANGCEITRWMSLSSSSFAWIGRAFTVHVWNSVRLTRGVYVPNEMLGRALSRSCLTFTATGWKSTLFLAGSERVLTGHRHTPQVAWAACC